MKQNKILLLIIIVLILTMSVSCSDKKEEKKKEQQKSFDEYSKNRQEQEKKSVKSKLDLLFLKYDVVSETLKEDLLKYLIKKDIRFILYKDIKEMKDEEKNNLTELFFTRDEIETEKLIEMSKKHNVPIRQISEVVYDYMIWKELENIKTTNRYKNE